MVEHTLELSLMQNQTHPLKTHVSDFFDVTLHHHNSPTDRARELFKRSKNAASLLVSIYKRIGKFHITFFCGWRHKWGRFSFFAQVTGPWVPTPRPNFWLIFSAQIRLSYESSKPLIDPLAFQVQTLRPKNRWVIDQLIRDYLINLLFLCHNFWN